MPRGHQFFLDRSAASGYHFPLHLPYSEAELQAQDEVLRHGQSFFRDGRSWAPSTMPLS